MKKPEPFVYTELHQAPPAWRRIDSARLSIAQLNEFVADAYENGTFGEPAEKGDEPPFRPDIGGARARFREKYRAEGGLWFARKEVG